MSNNTKVRAYFSRLVPFYLLATDEISDVEGFDAYPVEVDPVVLANVRSVRRLVETMENLFDRNPAPEEVAQTEVDEFASEVRLIFKTRAQDNG